MLVLFKHPVKELRPDCKIVEIIHGELFTGLTKKAIKMERTTSPSRQIADPKKVTHQVGVAL
jgi:hypothetical protein